MCPLKHMVLAFTGLLCILLPLSLSAEELAAGLTVQATPDGGLQPRLLVDQSGTVHLLYFKKRIDSPQAREGNLYYRQYLSEAGRWGNPVKVSSAAFNLQTVSISRAGMAIDGTGRIHVIWYLPREAQYLYSRSDEARTAFETQRSLVAQFAEGIDAGADIAANGNQVAVVWGAGDLSREYERSVFLRLSADNGATFGTEFIAGNTELGACACCSLATEFISPENLLIAYRSAIGGVGRHMQLLTLELAAGAIKNVSYAPLHELQEWELSSCPLSTNDIAAGPDGKQWLVFETAARIVQKPLQADSPPSSVAEPLTETRQKNPAIAFNKQGQHLIVWGEGISHSRGGRLSMRLFDSDGTGHGLDYGDSIEIPEFSFPAAAVLPNGSFLVLY